MKLGLLCGAALAPLAVAGAALAQSGSGAGPEGPVSSLEEVIVTGAPEMRNRTNDVVPTLSYDQEYFQRFEPLTVGDALKRVPSVTFLSDVLETDGVRLRGLDPGYTQILINGERVPGGEVDRAFFVDRIPAELIERVELVRSSSANRSGDALAGAVNIVLRDALSLDGGYLRAGTLLFPDEAFGGAFGAVYGGEVGPGRLLVSAAVQERRNPKDKFSQRFDAPGGTLETTEVQTDVRDRTDSSLNAAYEVALGGGSLDLAGLFVRTDQLQDEDSMVYGGGAGDPADLLTVNDNDVDIRTDSLSLRARYVRRMYGGETRFKLGFALFDDRQSEFENQAEYLTDDQPFPDEDRFTADLEFRDLRDEEGAAAIEHARPVSDGVELEFGVQVVRKDRDATTVVANPVRFDIPEAPAPRPAQPPFVFSAGRYAIDETRIDPYVMLSGGDAALRWEAGLRYEITEARVAGIDSRFAIALPSASLRYRLSDTDRLTLSAARTVRRADFDDLAPVTLRQVRGDNDFRGNPRLGPETAWGVDLGFERRLGRRGVVGVNAFYRDVTDLIEDISTGEQGSGGPGTAIESIDNVGDGQIHGLEFDLSTPLDFIGMESTGVFLNASWLDSRVEDGLGRRRFNDQSGHVVNFGFTHDLPNWGAAFGATYRKQGDAFGRVFAEEVTTSYGADLEVFLEKRLFANAVVRLTGSNLLDSAKREAAGRFDDRAAQIARDHNEYELDTERAGPVYQLVMRVAF